MVLENSRKNIKIEVKNVGGIEYHATEFHPGMNVLSGRNATNRTSLLKAVMALSGSDTPPLRSGTKEGYVKATIDGTEYVRTVRRTEDGYQWSGDQYCVDPTVAELYAFLLEQNEVRRAVVSGANLREIIMRPIDTSEIESQIISLKSEKREIEQKQESLDQKKDRVTNLEQLIKERELDLENARQHKKELDEKIADLDVDESDLESHNSEDESSELTQELNDVNQEITDVQHRIEVANNRLSNRKEELEEFNQTELGNVDGLRDEKQALSADISNLNEQKEEVERKKRAINPLRKFITQITGDSNTDNILSVLDEYSDDFNLPSGDEDVLSKLSTTTDQSESVCILCGNTVGTDHYEHIDEVSREVFKTLNGEINRIDDKISEKVDKRQNIEVEIGDILDTESRISELKSEIKTIKGNIESHESNLEELRKKAGTLNDQLDSIEDDTDDEAIQNLIQLNRDQSELAGQISELEATLERHRTEKQEKESEIEELEISSERLKEIEEEIESLRGKEERIEKEFVSEFNDQMESVLSELGYEGVERIWIERKQKRVKEGRKKVMKDVFDLNIVREVDGVATGDTIENLSESEREITSLVLAITGYRVHDVQNIFPIALVDSVEMVDAKRLEQLLKYLNEYPDYLIVAALAEDVNVMDIEQDNIQEMPSSA